MDSFNVHTHYYEQSEDGSQKMNRKNTRSEVSQLFQTVFN